MEKERVKSGMGEAERVPRERKEGVGEQGI